MSEPVPLRKIAGPEPVSDVVDLLRTILKEAESGEIRAIAIASIGAGMVFRTHVQGDSYMLPLLGAVTLLQHETSATMKANLEPARS